MAIKNHKSKNPIQTRKYSRPHQKYGTGTLSNNDTNPAQRQVPKPLKRGRKTPRYNNDNKNSTSLNINKNKRSKKKHNKNLMVIVDGCNSKRGAIPWQVILDDWNCATLCGATQINLRFILTAAHCIDMFKKNPRKSCPKKIVKKKIRPYPNNILSKYVSYFCCYTAKKSTYHNHRDNI